MRILMYGFTELTAPIGLGGLGNVEQNDLLSRSFR